MRPAGLPARIAWGALCVVVACVAVGAQMDREARRNLVIARKVPDIFRGYALEPLASDAYRRGDAEAGLALSRQMVERRPVPAESLSLLTNGLISTGREDAALPALLLSAQRGWRDRFTQRLMITVATQSGDWTVAAQRLVALWRQGDRGDRIGDLTQAVLSRPEGWAAFRNQIGGPEPWSTDFLLWAGPYLPGAAVRDISSAMAKQHVAVDCSRLSSRTKELVRAGRTQAAEGLWRALCANGRFTHPGDFAFKGLDDGSSGPFDWQFPQQAGLRVDFASDGGHTVLQYSNSEPFRGVVAKRGATVAPGRHVARVDAHSNAEGGSRALTLGLMCFSETGEAKRLPGFPLDAQGTEFAIPLEGCASQEFEISAPRGDGEIRGFSIDP